MGRFLARRLLFFLITLWAVITVSFFLMRSVQGGPFDEERSLHPAAKTQIEQRYHLDWPIWKQYLHYLGPLNLDQDGLFGNRSRISGGVLVLDFGPSFRMRDFSVNEIIKQALPNSVMIGGLALFFALFVGVALGSLSAWNQDSWIDRCGMGLAALGIALPNYLLASFAIIAFCFVLPIFPPAGWGEWRHLLLPSLVLSLPFAASIARLVRTGALELLSQDFLRLAKGKGLSSWQIYSRHTLPASLLPVLSYLGPAAAGILTGSLVIEKIFAIPGLGTHFVQSALNRDYTLAMGITVLYTALIYFFNTLIDIGYRILDPRVGAKAS